MSDAIHLRGLANRLEKRDHDLGSLGFCLDVYLEFNRDGRKPTEHMDKDKSAEQLVNAVARVLGLPPQYT